MPLYECVFIARQDIPIAQVDGLSSHFSSIIAENGGKVTKTEYWGLKNLAYRIKKNRKGHYVLFNIDSPWAAVREMERLMHLNEDVLRFLTLRVETLDEGPSVMMQGRTGRDSRRERGERSERSSRDWDGGREGRDRDTSGGMVMPSTEGEGGHL
jgi:small subunit ribosomal protein S6